MFDAYGDESCGSEFVTYGVLVVPARLKPRPASPPSAL